MAWQSFIVALLVLGCSAYAGWTLAPRALRRFVAAGLLRHPRLAGVPALQRLARAPGAFCGCDGCDRAPATTTTTTAPAVVHWQPRRQPERR